MYHALNKRVIAIPQSQETKTASGIIIEQPGNACVPYQVAFTNDLTKDLQDKIVYAEARYLNHKLPPGDNGENYVVIPLEEILAVKA